VPAFLLPRLDSFGDSFRCKRGINELGVLALETEAVRHLIQGRISPGDQRVSSQVVDALAVANDVQDQVCVAFVLGDDVGVWSTRLFGLAEKRPTILVKTAVHLDPWSV
jgi:hypothetical protein